VRSHADASDLHAHTHACLFCALNAFVPHSRSTEEGASAGGRPAHGPAVLHRRLSCVWVRSAIELACVLPDGALTRWWGAKRSSYRFGRYMTNTRIKLITVVDDEGVKEDDVRSVSLASSWHCVLVSVTSLTNLHPEGASSGCRCCGGCTGHTLMWFQTHSMRRGRCLRIPVSSIASAVFSVQPAACTSTPSLMESSPVCSHSLHFDLTRKSRPS
jgi:hypothetical protein